MCARVGFICLLFLAIQLDFRSTHTWNTDQPSTSNLANDLDSTIPQCVVGTAPTLTRVYDWDGACGFSFRDGPDPSNTFWAAYTTQTLYESPSSICVNAASGRIWFGAGNSACNAAKFYVRSGLTSHPCM